MNLKEALTCPEKFAVIVSEHQTLGTFVLQADQNVEIAGTSVSRPCVPLFTENESHWQGGYTKDAIHHRVVDNKVDATNPANEGTKAGLWYTTAVPSKRAAVFKLRLFNPDDAKHDPSLARARTTTPQRMRKNQRGAGDNQIRPRAPTGGGVHGELPPVMSPGASCDCLA
jgi:hypothetical protein